MDRGTNEEKERVQILEKTDKKTLEKRCSLGVRKIIEVTCVYLCVFVCSSNIHIYYSVEKYVEVNVGASARARAQLIVYKR